MPLSAASEAIIKKANGIGSRRAREARSFQTSPESIAAMLIGARRRERRLRQLAK